MPKFDYQAAKQAGHSDEEIAAFLEERNAAGDSLFIEEADLQPVDTASAVEEAKMAVAKAAAGPFAGAVAPITWALGQLQQRESNTMQNIAAASTDNPIEALGDIATGVVRGAIQNKPPEGEAPAQGIKPALARVGYTKTPIPPEAIALLNSPGVGQGLPTGSIAGFLTSPDGLDIAASMLLAVPENAAAQALVKGASLAGRATGATKALRGAAGKAGLQHIVPRMGIADPAVADFYKKTITRAQGREFLRNAQSKKAAERYSEIAVEMARNRSITVDEAEVLLRDAAETFARTSGKSVAGLASEEQEAVSILREVYGKQIERRVRRELRPNELSANIGGPGAPVAPGGPGAVDYVSRPLTEHELARRTPAGKPAKRYGNASGLSTSQGPRRGSEAHLTSSDIERAAGGGQGRQVLFRPQSEALPISEAHNNAILAHADVVNEIAESRGRMLRPGELPGPDEARLSDIGGVLQGYSDEAIERLTNTVLPRAEVDYLRQFSGAMAPQRWGKIRELMLKWKSIVLFSPRFISRNVQNNIFFGAIHGEVNPKRWTDGVRLAVGKIDPKQYLKDVGMTAEEYVKDAALRGVAATGLRAEFIPGAGKQGIPGRVASAFQRRNQEMEDAARYTMDRYFQRKGMDAWAAAERVREMFGNYDAASFTPLVNSIRRNVLPFGAWRANILKATAGTFARRPGSLAVYENARLRIQEAAGFTPEQEQTQLAEYRKQRPGLAIRTPDGLLMTTLPAGIYDLNQYQLRELGMDHEAVKQLFGEMYPVLTVTANLLLNKDSFGRPLSRGEGLGGKRVQNIVKLPTYVAVLPKVAPGVADALDIKLKDGVPYGTARTGMLLRSMQPFPMVNMMGDLGSPDPNARRRALAFFTGVSQTMVHLEDERRNIGFQKKAQIRNTKAGKKAEPKLERKIEREAARQ